MPAPTTPSEAIATKLINDTAVGALVADRIYPSKPTANPTWPYIVFFKAGGGDGVNLGGFNKLQNYTMRIECYSQTEGEAEAIMKAVNAAFDGWIDVTNKVKGCLPNGDADQQTLEDGSQVSGQSFSLWFLTA